jgi:FkbM family methyltransferase
MKSIQGVAFPDADQFMAAEMQADGTYQRSNLEAALRFVTEFGTAIDGGAHVGLWAKLMADAFQKVIAFEPSPDTFECLIENVRTIEHIQCEPYAVGAVAGAAGMALDDVNAARANTGARRLVEGAEVPVATIDSYNLDRVGFIKLDIEGSEPFALQGAADTIRRCRPIVLYEDKKLWTRYYGLPKSAVEDILRGHGYQQLGRAHCDAIWGPR